MHLPFWTTTLSLSPLLALQAVQARRQTERLPEATGTPAGQWGEDPARHKILVLGESTAAGVGVERHQQGLACQLAYQWYLQSGDAVAWQTWGTNGAQLRHLLAKLDNSPQWDATHVVLSMGVNDTVGLTGRRRYRQELQALQTRLAYQPLYLLAVPPMELFSALPSPLRHILGWRARQLDRVQQQLAQHQPQHFHHLPYPVLNQPDLFARDGYHPSEKGYKALAYHLAPSLFARLAA